MSSNINQNLNQIIYNLKLSGGTLRKKMSSTSNNKKVLYQLWTNGKGSFAVWKIGSQLFEYSNSQYTIDKILDSKMLYDGSITEELVQDWIRELKQEDILDENGNLIYVTF